MKKYRFNKTTIFFCFLFVFGCQKEIIPVIELGISELNLQSDNSNNTVNFTTNVEWTATVTDITKTSSWLSIYPSNGPAGNIALRLNCQENNSVIDRESKLTIVSGILSKSLLIRQHRAAASLVIDTTSKVVDYKAGIINIIFTTNADWSANLAQNILWATILPASGIKGNSSFSINYLENVLNLNRECLINLKVDTINRAIKITQNKAPATLSIDTCTIQVDHNQSSKSITVTTNSAPWTTSSTPDWVTITPKSGQKSEVVRIDIKQNSLLSKREANIVFTAGNDSKTLRVTQAGEPPYLTIDKTENTVNYPANSFTVNLSTNISWESRTTNTNPWISISPKKGEKGNHSIKINVEENKMNIDREDVITFSGGSISTILNVTQTKAPPSITLLSYESETDYKAKILYNEIYTNNAKWQSSSLPDWITLNPNNGSGPTFLTISIKENRTDQKREVIIIFSSDSEQKHLKIIQNHSNGYIDEGKLF